MDAKPINSAAEPIISVANLTKRFGSLVAVDNLNFEVYEGEIFGFLGPNGAGKSTTLNILATLLKADQGEISIAGCNFRTESKQIKVLLGVVPQEIALFVNLTAYENVAYFAGLYGLRGAALREAVREALEFVGLGEQARKRASTMSGGMKRRLNIACGIAHHPRIIILDEPTVGVDAQSREHIMDSIRTLRERGATIIYTSHYMPEVQEICDRIAIIDHGKLVAQGSEEELLAVVTDVRSILVDCELPPSIDVALLSERIGLLPDVRRVTWLDGTEILSIDVALAFSDMTPLLSLLMEDQVIIRSLSNEAPNLESTFLALTGRELRQD